MLEGELVGNLGESLLKEPPNMVVVSKHFSHCCLLWFSG